MSRAPVRIILDVVGTLAFALVLLIVILSVFSGSIVEGLAESPRVLLLFMGTGVIVWIILIVISALRSRGVAPDARTTVLFAGLGAAANVVLFIVVGIVEGGWALLFVLFATMGGVAFLVAAAIVVPLLHRATSPRPVEDAPRA